MNKLKVPIIQGTLMRPMAHCKCNLAKHKYGFYWVKRSHGIVPVVSVS